MACEAEITELGAVGVPKPRGYWKVSIPVSGMDSGGGERKRVGAQLFYFYKGPSLVTFHIDGVKETLQQGLLQYFTASESIPYLHVAFVQEFLVTREKLQYFG